MLRTTLQAAADQAAAGHTALRTEFQHDITGLRTEIQNTLGDALTRINAKVTDIDQDTITEYEEIKRQPGETFLKFIARF